MCCFLPSRWPCKHEARYGEIWKLKKRPPSHNTTCNVNKREFSVAFLNTHTKRQINYNSWFFYPLMLKLCSTAGISCQLMKFLVLFKGQQMHYFKRTRSKDMKVWISPIFSPFCCYYIFRSFATFRMQYPWTN